MDKQYDANKTLDYYNNHAATFTKDTISVEFEEKQNMLLKYLELGMHILDFGCGSGRDSKAFLQKGYQVTAMDGSNEMCKVASQTIGQEVICKKFQDLESENVYDGVWACASILHVPLVELSNIIEKIAKVLKPNGYFYASFKYGDFEGQRNGRYFTDMTEKRLKVLLAPFQQLEIIEIIITSDVREGRQDEKWLNVIVKKK